MMPLKKSVADLKTADICSVEMMKDLDGEFMTKKGLVRAGVEIVFEVIITITALKNTRG